MHGVTDNGTAAGGSVVTCDRCGHDDLFITNRKWSQAHTVHCPTCHQDGHRACICCGECLPDNHRWDRTYCSSTCRVRHRGQRAATPPTDCTAITVRDARREAKRTAERCARCDCAFASGQVIYRRAHPGSLQGSEVLPYCAECRNASLFAALNWSNPAPCEFCGRPVSNDAATADPHKFTTRGTARTFCCERCRDDFHREAARERRPSTDRECEACGEVFTARRSDALYCSPACRQRAHRARQEVRR